MDWSLGSFNIAVYDNDEQLLAEAKVSGTVSDNGFFGIHRWKHDLYSLVHIPSGRYIANNIWSDQRAMAIARRIMTLPVDWESPRPLALLTKEQRGQYELMKEPE